LPYNFSICSDTSNTITTEKAWISVSNTLNLMVLCPIALTPPLTLSENSDRYRDFSQVLGANVETLMRYTSSTIFHMLLHINWPTTSMSTIL
jgi:membrane associated rhomboid family serine protease